MEKQNKLDIKRILIILVLTLIFVVIAISIYSYMTGKAVEEQEKLKDWLIDNCNCTEKNHIFCSDNYEYNGKYCVYENYFTYASKGCSKYECSDGIYNLNLENKKWQKEN